MDLRRCPAHRNWNRPTTVHTRPSPRLIAQIVGYQTCRAIHGVLFLSLASYDDRAGGVTHAMQAHRTQRDRGKGAVSPISDGQDIGALGFAHEHKGGITLGTVNSISPSSSSGSVPLFSRSLG
jgi:hypothetical protein